MTRWPVEGLLEMDSILPTDVFWKPEVNAIGYVITEYIL